MALAVISGQIMETIIPILQTRIKLPDAPPEAVPENPQEGFAQVMARQEKSSRPKENPEALDRDGAAPKTTLTPKERSKPKSSDPATDPEVTSSQTTPVSNAVLPSLTNRDGEPPVNLEDPTFSLRQEGQTPVQALAPIEQIDAGSKIQPGPGDIAVKSVVPEVRPLDSLLAGASGETRGPVLFPRLPAQVGEDLRNPGETGPAAPPALVQPEGTLKENPLASKAVEDLLLHLAPESLTITQKASPKKTEQALRSFLTTAEKGPSFSPQGPAIPKTILIVDGQDPSPSLVLRRVALKGQDSETTTSPEMKPESQASPLEDLSRTERIATAPIVEGPLATEADPAEPISKIMEVSEKNVSPASSKENLSERGISSLARPEGLPNPEKTSPTIDGPDPKTFFLHRAAPEKAAPGIPLRNPGENPSGSGGPEMNNPIRFQEDTPLGVLGKFPDPLQVEAAPADRLVGGPPKGSPEWTKEAVSVYQQYSKGLLRTLQQRGERIQMTLDPPQLGNILVEINRDRNLVTAHLWTDNPHTKELLDFSQGQLQKTLELDGFKLDRFEVLVQPDLKSFQEERWFGGRQPAWENNREGGGREAPEGLIPTTPEETTGRFSRGNRYVDTWV